MEQGGGGTETPSVAAVRPASTDVLRELEGLRERDGISPVKLRQIAPLIQHLPVVEDHRLLKGFNPSDQHVAAYGAIGCVLEHGITDAIWQQILILTLRYNYNLLDIAPGAGWDTVRDRPSLRARHNLVMAMLSYGRTRYYELVRLAYDELAAQLLLRDTSPCRGATVQQLVQVPQELAIDQLLALFSIAGHDLIRERIAVKALEQVDARWSASGSTATECLVSVVRQALTSEYAEVAQAYLEARQRGGLLVRIQKGPYRWTGFVIRPNDLDHLITGDPILSFLDRVESIPRLLSGAIVPHDDRQRSGLVIESTYKAGQIARSYALLGGVLSSDDRSKGNVAVTLAESDAKAAAEFDSLKSQDPDIPAWLKADGDEE